MTPSCEISMGAAAWASMGSVRMRSAVAADAAAESVRKERRDAEIILILGSLSLDTGTWDTGTFDTAHLTRSSYRKLQALGFRLWA